MIASGETRPTNRFVTAAAPDEPLPAKYWGSVLKAPRAGRSSATCCESLADG